ncbi:unnamed protein product, partial [Heterotrigona itama]
MMKIDKYRSDMVIAIQYFDTKEWTFYRCSITGIMTKVKKSISCKSTLTTLEDDNVVKLDLQDMNWKKYIANYQVRMKKFILKNPRPMNSA